LTLDRHLEAEPTSLHEQRLATVLQVLLDSGATSVLDLGCGTGALLNLLLREKQFVRVTGVEASSAALSIAERELFAGGRAGHSRLSLIHGSFADEDARLTGFDAAAMVETIEHVDPGRLSSVERAVFALYRPRIVVMTTPNVEYNVLYGMPDGALREPDHWFEWSRAKFRTWATGVAKRNGYTVVLADIGEEHPMLGCPTQMAIFSRAADRSI
jgi:small RNA 2'-O-methyltransferase